MSAASNQEAMKRFKRAKEIIIMENKQAAFAVYENNISKIEKIFKTGGIEQEAIDYLIFGVRSLGMMKLFLRYGGDIHKLGPPLHPTPITLLVSCIALLRKYAVDSVERRDLVKIAKFLIEKGADVNAVDRAGDTPFMNCASEGDVKLCELLVDRGADPSARREDGRNALHAAAIMDCIDMLRYLVEDCGLDIDAECQDEKTALCIAAVKGNIKVCNFLLVRGAGVDVGAQPLMGAAQVSLLRFIFL
jgi:hypothetical protein